MSAPGLYRNLGSHRETALSVIAGGGCACDVCGWVTVCVVVGGGVRGAWSAAPRAPKHPQHGGSIEGCPVPEGAEAIVQRDHNDRLAPVAEAGAVVHRQRGRTCHDASHCEGPPGG